MMSHTHPAEVRLTVETRDEGPATHITFHGEADSTNLADLEAALANVPLNGAEQVRLDVSDLGFVDVAALRELTRFARGLKESGREVKTCDAQPLLQQMVRTVGARDDLGLA